jgi:hypothetical protein
MLILIISRCGRTCLTVLSALYQLSSDMFANFCSMHVLGMVSRYLDMICILFISRLSGYNIHWRHFKTDDLYYYGWWSMMAVRIQDKKYGTYWNTSKITETVHINLKDLQLEQLICMVCLSEQRLISQPWWKIKRIFSSDPIVQRKTWEMLRRFDLQDNLILKAQLLLSANLNMIFSRNK